KLVTGVQTCALPISHTDLPYALDTPNAGRQFRTEQTGISCLVCHTPDRGQTEIDRCWSKAPLFQVDSISEDNGAVEGKSRFRAIPLDELIYGVIVRSLAAFRGQAVQYGRLRLFKIGKGKRSLRRSPL